MAGTSQLQIRHSRLMNPNSKYSSMLHNDYTTLNMELTGYDESPSHVHRVDHLIEALLALCLSPSLVKAFRLANCLPSE